MSRRHLWEGALLVTVAALVWWSTRPAPPRQPPSFDSIEFYYR